MPYQLNYSAANIDSLLGRANQSVRATNHLLVNSVDDLPAPTGDEHILPANTLVEFGNLIDLGSNAIRLSDSTTLRGLNPNLDGVMSTNTNGVIRATDLGSNLIMREMLVIAPAGPALDVSESTLVPQMNIFFIGFLGCASVGTITGFNVVSLDHCYIGPLGGSIPQGGITFEGTSKKLHMISTVFEDFAASATGVTLGSTCTTEVVDFRGSYFKSTNNSTVFEVDPSATVGLGYVLNNLGIEENGSNITTLVGIDVGTPNWTFANNVGIPDSRVLGGFFTTTQNLTTITTQNEWVKANLTTTASPWIQRVTVDNNRLTYNGGVDVITDFAADFVLDAQSNNNIIELAVFLNGSEIPESLTSVRVGTGGDQRNGTCNGLIQLSPGDFLELYVRNTSDTADVNFITANMTLSD